MKLKKITAAIILTAVLLISLCSCADREGYMTNNCGKDGVAALISEYPELKNNGFTKKTTYNITPDGFGDVKLFKSSETAYTVALYPGYSYTYVDISGSPGLISASLCDAYGRGEADILFTYCDDATGNSGIGIYDGVLGYSRSVARFDGSVKLYLSREEAREGMPVVYSVLTVTVTEFKNNPADLGCVAVGEAGTVTFGADGPVFNANKGKDVNVVPVKFTDVSRVIISTVSETKTYDDKDDIEAVGKTVQSLDGGEERTAPSGGTTYIIAFVYHDGSVGYVYYNDTGAFKHHGGAWCSAEPGRSILPASE